MNVRNTHNELINLNCKMLFGLKNIGQRMKGMEQGCIIGQDAQRTATGGG